MFVEIRIAPAVLDELKNISLIDERTSYLIDNLTPIEFTETERNLAQKVWLMYSNWLETRRKVAIEPDSQRGEIESLVYTMGAHDCTTLVIFDNTFRNFFGVLWRTYSEQTEELNLREFNLAGADLEGIENIQIGDLTYILWKALDYCEEIQRIGEFEESARIIGRVQEYILLWRRNNHLSFDDARDLQENVNWLAGDQMPRDDTIAVSKKKELTAERLQQIRDAIRHRNWAVYHELLRGIACAEVMMQVKMTREWQDYEEDVTEKSFEAQRAELEKRCTPQQMRAIEHFAQTGNAYDAAGLAGMNPLDFLDFLRIVNYKRYFIEQEREEYEE